MLFESERKSSLVAGEPDGRGPWLPWLAGWRGLAITSLLLGHFLSDLFPNAGVIGVEMFFVLSGRLIASILFVEKRALVDFLRGRVTRIWPGLLLFLVTVTTMVNILPLGSYMYVRPLDAAAAVPMFYNFLAGPGGLCPPIDNLWSLCVEEHAYLLLATVAHVARRQGSRPQPILLAGAVLSMIDGVLRTTLFGQGFVAAGWRSDAHVASMLFSAWVYLEVQSGKVRMPTWTAPAFAVLGALLFNPHVPIVLWLTAGSICFSVAVNTLDQTYPVLHRILSGRLLCGLARRSFSIYLWQQPFFVIASWQLGAGPFLSLIFILAAIIVGSASHTYEERAKGRLDAFVAQFLQPPCRLSSER